MDIRGTVIVIMKGPAEAQQAALDAIQAANIYAEKSRFERFAVEAYFSDGTTRPSNEYIQACEAKAAAAAKGTGFKVDRTAINSSNAATRMLIVDKQTDEVLAFADTENPPWLTQESLEYIAKSRGCPVEQLELREPPELQIPTE